MAAIDFSSPKTRIYALMSAFMFALFFAQAMGISLLSLWLVDHRGLTGEQVGIVFSANFVAAMMAYPVFGFVSDKVGLRKHVIAIVAGLVLLCGPFFFYVYGPLLETNLILGAVVGGAYVGTTFVSGCYATESYVDRVGRHYGFEWGQTRLWGSFGFATAAFFSGRLYTDHPGSNFWLASAAALVMLAVVALVPIRPTAEEVACSDRLRLRDTLSVLLRPKFWGFMVLILGVTNLYLVYDQQFPNYFASFFPTKAEGVRMFGYLNSTQIFLEAGGMFISPWIVRRLGAKRGLLLAATIMVVRIAGSSVADGPLTISCMKMLHSLELPILLVSMFRYIAAHFEGRFASTVYLVGVSFGHSLGLAILSPIVGKGYDMLGFPITYQIIAAIAAVFLILSFWFLEPTAPEVGGSRPRSPKPTGEPENIAVG